MNHSNPTHSSISALHGFFMCLLAAIFYLYSFALRIMPSAMTHELMSGLNMHAQMLGLLVGCIYYGYMLMQIPAGLLFDRFQARYLLTIAPLFCASGALLFAIAHSVDLASFGGFLMGIGQAFSFIGVLIIAARVYSPQLFAFIAGITQLLGSLGAILGEAPMAWFSNHIGWRQSVLGMAVIGLILAILIFLVIRDPVQPIQNLNKPTESFGQRLRIIMMHRQNLWLALYAFTIWGPVVIFGGLWAVPYLMRLYHVHNTAAAAAASWIWIGVGIGSPLFGWWSDRIGKRRLPLMISASIGIVMAFSMLYTPHMPWWLMSVVLFLLGVGGSGQSLSFAVSRDNNPPHLAATAVALTNTAVVMGGVILQPLVGWLLHWRSHYTMIHGVPIYSLVDYKHSLIIAPLCAVIALIVSSFFLKETHASLQQ